MQQIILNMLVTLFIVGTALANDTPPPIPVVAPSNRAIVGVQRPKSDNVMSRTESFNKKAQEGGFDVMFIGDSITHCWEFDHGKEEWDKKIARFNAVNFGIGGDTTDTVIWRLDHGNLTGALNPKVIVLMIGTNNGHRDKPAETAAGIGAIISRLHERLPKAKILLYAIFPRVHPGGEGLSKHNDEVNKIIAKYDGHWNIKYVDIEAKFLKPDGNLIEGAMYDGLHPAKKGYEIWADSLATELGEILDKAQKH